MLAPIRSKYGVEDDLQQPRLEQSGGRLHQQREEGERENLPVRAMKLADKTCAHQILGRIKTTIDAHGLPPRGRSSEVHLYWPPRGEGWMPRRNADRHIVGTGE